MTAGVEGGSKARVESDWSMNDVDDIREYWRTNGLPTHIALVPIARSLGIELCPPPTQDEVDTEEPGDGPSIADLTARLTVPPVAGGDTLAASRALLEALHGG